MFSSTEHSLGHQVVLDLPVEMKQTRNGFFQVPPRMFVTCALTSIIWDPFSLKPTLDVESDWLASLWRKNHCSKLCPTMLPRPSSPLRCWATLNTFLGVIKRSDTHTPRIDLEHPLMMISPGFSHDVLDAHDWWLGEDNFINDQHWIYLSHRSVSWLKRNCAVGIGLFRRKLCDDTQFGTSTLHWLH